MDNRYSKFRRHVMDIGIYREIFCILSKYENLTAGNVLRKIENLESSKCTDVVGLEIQDITLITQRDVIVNGTLLHAAAAVGCRKIAYLMLENGADVEGRCSKGYTPLHYAVKCNQIELIELLLEKRADVNALTFIRMTSLHLAAALGSTEALKLLLSAGARVQGMNFLGITPLHLAVNALVKRTIPKNVALLLSSGSPVNAVDHKGNTALHSAILKTDNTIVLEGSLIDPDEKNAEYEKRRIARLNKDTGTKKVIKLLVNHGAVVDARNFLGETPLHLAVLYSSGQVIQLLVQRGANVNSCGWRGYTLLRLLHRRVEFDSEEYIKIIKILIQNGHDVTLPDIIGPRIVWITPTTFSMSSKSKFIVQRIIDRAVAEHPYRIKPSYVRRFCCLSVYWDFVTDKAIRESKRLSDINRKISFRDFLRIKNANKLALLLQNRNVLSMFDNRDWEIDYPIFGRDIKEQYEKAVKRLKLLNKGEENLAKLFHKSTGHPQLLPRQIGRKIVLYLTDNEIKRANKVARKYC